MSRLLGYLRLMRLANIVTAITDVLAGVAIAGSAIGFVNPQLPEGSSLGQTLLTHFSSVPVYHILWLVLSTSCLYGGGVVLNDVFDASLDRIERPERPIPSGLVSRKAAGIFGSILLLCGIAAAALSAGTGDDASEIRPVSAGIAIVIAVGCVAYDKWSKHNAFFGPLNMGICRGLNLLLGMSITPYLWLYSPLAIVPVIYIAAITMISRGEVHGGKKFTLYVAGALYLFVMGVIAYFSYLNGHLQNTLILLLIFALLVFPALQRAIQKPEGPRIGKAVKSGVIALIVMNASWAAAFGDIYFACVILLLLPLSLYLARLFAVT